MINVMAARARAIASRTAAAVAPVLTPLNQRPSIPFGSATAAGKRGAATTRTLTPSSATRILLTRAPASLPFGPRRHAATTTAAPITEDHDRPADPKKWTDKHVQAWFEDHNEGQWKKYASRFEGLMGAQMSELSKEDFRDFADHPNGRAIYNDWRRLVGAAGADEVAAFRDAVLGADVDDSACVITLPEGTPWLSLKEATNGNILFVRHFYAPFFDSVLGGMLRGEGEAGGTVIVLGNPGIGKSAFGMYALYRLLRDGRTVVYQSEAAGECFVFSNGGVRVVEPVTRLGGKNNVPELKDPATAFITDSIQPPVVNAKTLLITRPKREKYWQFGKEAQKLYFPIYSRSEMVACGAACFPLVPVEDIERRFARWGGIPRYVLQKLDDDSQALLKSALRGASALQHLLDNLYEDRTDHEVPHRILHIRIRGEFEPELAPSSLAFYSHAKPSFASDYVADEIWAQAQAQGKTRLREFVGTAAGDPTLSALRGSLLEGPLTESLLAGGTFRVRRLRPHGGRGASADVVDVELPQSTRVDCRDVAEAASASASGADSMCVFTKGNEAAVDALLCGGAAANFTIDETHTIVAGALEKVYSSVDDGWWRERLGTGDARVFVWVVPPDVFPSFDNHRSFKDGKRVVTGKELPPVLRDVVQFVLEVPVGLQPPTRSTQ